MFDLLFGPDAIGAVQAFLGPGRVTPFRLLAYLGTSQAALVLLTLAFWLGGRALALQIAGAGLLAAAFNLLIWLFVSIPRPDYPQIQVYDSIAAPAFPSGHVAAATALWGLLAVRGRLPRVLFPIVVLVEMLSRVYLGVSHLGDVLAGFAVGCLAVLVLLLLWRLLAGWLVRLPGPLVLLLGAVPLGLAFLAYPFVPLDAELEVWRALGLAVGGLAAFLLEYTLVHYTAARTPPGDRLIGAGLALSGVAIALVATAIGVLVYSSPALAAVAMSLGAAWGLFVVPALYRIALSALSPRAA